MQSTFETLHVHGVSKVACDVALNGADHALARFCGRAKPEQLVGRFDVRRRRGGLPRPRELDLGRGVTCDGMEV